VNEIEKGTIIREKEGTLGVEEETVSRKTKNKTGKNKRGRYKTHQ